MRSIFGIYVLVDACRVTKGFVPTIIRPSISVEFGFRRLPVRNYRRPWMIPRDAVADNYGSQPSTRVLEEYIKECLQQVETMPPSHMTITEQHRKPILRTLLGRGLWTKADLKQKIKAYTTRKQWEKTLQFLSRNKNDLIEGAKILQKRDESSSSSNNNNDNNVMTTAFQEGLKEYLEFQDRPDKLFSFMSRGRKYQGKFEKLVEDLNRPEWHEEYRSIFEEKQDVEILRMFVLDYLATEDSVPGSCDRKQEEESLRKRLVMAALEQEFPKAVPQPADGGKSMGIEGEMNLLTFLQCRVHDDDDDNSSSSPRQWEVLAPVFIQNQRKGRKLNKKCPYTVDLPPNYDLTGKTSELDAMVVEIFPNNEIHVHQIWEAKATLHPVTMADALWKKGQVLEYFVGDEALQESVQVYLHGKPHPISLDRERRRPRLGIFGKALLNPLSGIRRLEHAIAEAEMERNVDAIEEALMTGRISISKDRIRSELERLMALACKYQATMVVQSDLIHP